MNKRLVLLFCFLVGCVSAPKRPALSPKEAPVLTKEEALHRSKKVSNVQYDLDFNLDKKSKNFKGRSKIYFTLKDNTTPLRVDYYNGKVLALRINGTKFKPQYNGHYLLVPGDQLLEGKNEIIIEFQSQFSRDGSGLYRFEDPEDKRVYTYSDLEPFDANKIFPCFDQPNLKATYRMKVTVPKLWTVITSVLPNKKRTKGEYQTWYFSESALFSTYIWSLHAGPYKMYTDKKAKYPSRVFIRRSLAKYIRVEDWHTFTRQSFDFLDEYFGHPYPYKKYDQVIVPDFNAGAMENVAAVTFSERFISRGVKKEEERRRLANVIFHEMAHMWFGNLVTMNWWNDLWLNESFATYMANLGVSRNTEFKNQAWRDFRGTKEWALWEDQLVTTHPIEAKVPDTSQAFANFDGITYGKGASSLKQIHYYLGEKGFKKGLQIYFKRHANSNTELKDFIQALSDGAGKDLVGWQKDWLQTTGVNTVSVDYACKDDKINKFVINQSANARPHAFQIALLNHEYAVHKVLKASIDRSSIELDQAIGLACPSIVFPNYNDHDYIMVKLDDKSLVNIQNSIHKIEDTFLRQLIWSTLWQMVYYGEFSYLKYANIVESKFLPYEKDPILMGQVLKRLTGRYSNAPGIMKYLAFDDNINVKSKKQLIQNLEKNIWKLLNLAKPKSEMQKLLFQSYLEISESNIELDKLAYLLKGKIILNGLKIDQDKRWSIIKKLNSFNYPGAKQMASKELLKDKSSFGKKMKLASEAIRPDWGIKNKWIKEYMKKESAYSFSELKTVLYNLFPRHQQIEQRSRYTNFFSDIEFVNKNKDIHIAETFVALAPQNCHEKNIDALTKFLSSSTGLAPGVEKGLKIMAQENKRCRAVLDLAHK